MKQLSTIILQMNHSTQPLSLLPKSSIPYYVTSIRCCFSMPCPMPLWRTGSGAENYYQKDERPIPSFNKNHHLDSSQGFKTDRMLLEIINQKLYRLESYSLISFFQMQPQNTVRKLSDKKALIILGLSFLTITNTACYKVNLFYNLQHSV